MLSLRLIARSSPRVLARAASTASRSYRACGALPGKASTVAPAPRGPRQPVVAASSFSTSAARRETAAGEVDEEILAKLDSEIKFETDVRENESAPPSIKDFLDNGPFELHDTAGREEVRLTRQFGKEKITVMFSIADLQNVDPDAFDDEQDPALSDDDGAAASSPAAGRAATTATAAVPSRRSGPDDSEDGAEEDEFAGEDDGAPVPCRLNVIIEKPGGGALNVHASVQDGAVIVDNLFFFPDAKLAFRADPASSLAAEQIYPGPPFGNLDEDLQVLVERYLEERGVTPALAVFVPDYIEMKEQKEYVAWLKRIQGFVKA